MAPAIVSAVDEYGNEVAGVRLPAVRRTGRDVHGVERPAADAACPPSSPTSSAAGCRWPPSPTPLRDHEAYGARLRAVAAALVADRLLLAADADLAVAQAVGEKCHVGKCPGVT